MSKKEPRVQGALKDLVEFGAPEKEVYSKESCFLYLENDHPRLSLDSLIYDWDGLYEIICKDKIGQVSIHNQTESNPYRRCIALKYGLFLS